VNVGLARYHCGNPCLCNQTRYTCEAKGARFLMRDRPPFMEQQWLRKCVALNDQRSLERDSWPWRQSGCEHRCHLSAPTEPAYVRNRPILLEKLPLMIAPSPPTVIQVQHEGGGHDDGTSGNEARAIRHDQSRRIRSRRPSAESGGTAPEPERHVLHFDLCDFGHAHAGRQARQQDKGVAFWKSAGSCCGAEKVTICPGLSEAAWPCEPLNRAGWRCVQRENRTGSFSGIARPDCWRSRKGTRVIRGGIARPGLNILIQTSSDGQKFVVTNRYKLSHACKIRSPAGTRTKRLISKRLTF
jgi:hypothetical protein